MRPTKTPTCIWQVHESSLTEFALFAVGLNNTNARQWRKYKRVKIRDNHRIITVPATFHEVECAQKCQQRECWAYIYDQQYNFGNSEIIKDTKILNNDIDINNGNSNVDINNGRIVSSSINMNN